jgi:hypothetical protein
MPNIKVSMFVFKEILSALPCIPHILATKVTDPQNSTFRYSFPKIKHQVYNTGSYLRNTLRVNTEVYTMQLQFFSFDEIIL